MQRHQTGWAGWDGLGRLHKTVFNLSWGGESVGTVACGTYTVLMLKVKGNH